jgi:BirA family transcriptional regulator, biotin operon repressor / biotin---[acetyl-CoA-carboxylase] ligase
MASMLGDERARGLTLVADYQERGAGRKGRTWIAPPGTALLCTIGLPDALPATNLWAIPFWVAIVVRAAIAELGIDARLQWPNDVLIDERKVAGILCISRVMGDEAWVGCGIGVNVHRPKDETTLAQIHPPPAFLSDRTNADRSSLLQAILGFADTSYDDLRFPDRITETWQFAALVPGTRYRLLLDGESQPFEATALRLLPGGALLVDRDGIRREIALADARVLRD